MSSWYGRWFASRRQSSPCLSVPAGNGTRRVTSVATFGVVTVASAEKRGHSLRSQQTTGEGSTTMNGHVYGLSEIVGSSTQGVDDAIRVAVQRAARTLRGLDWFEVTNIRGHLADGEIEHFQVTLKIGFRMEDPEQTRTA